MIENGYIAILQHDSLQMRHPSKQNKIVTLYRIIATKTFKLEKFNRIINRYDIGGYIESIENLDPQNVVWVDNSARVFDSAKVLNGSLIRGAALIYENAEVENTEVSGNCRIHGNSRVEGSTVEELSEVLGKAKVFNSSLKKSCKIFGNACIVNSDFSVAATAHENCVVEYSTVTDISEICGDAHVQNCKYSGRVIKKTGSFKNETIDHTLDLKIHEEVDPDYHKSYTV